MSIKMEKGGEKIMSTFKIGDTVTWKKTEGSKAQDWTGTVLKVYENGVAVEWIGARNGTMKVQGHFNAEAANVLPQGK